MVVDLAGGLRTTVLMVTFLWSPVPPPAGLSVGLTYFEDQDEYQRNHPK